MSEALQVHSPHLDLGLFPTPVDELPALCPSAGARLFCKREDLSGGDYGGNKVRKLEHILHAALRRGAPLLTVGAVGSHHVVASAWYGRAQGLPVHALLGPQPDTPHVREHARIALGLLAGAWPLASWARLPLVLARASSAIERQHGQAPLVVAPGGSSVDGCLGTVRLGLELAQDVERGALPAPDRVYVAVGSGGTAAGLWLGLRAAGLHARVIGVRTAPALMANAAQVRALAGRLRRHLGWRLPLPLDHAPLLLDGRWLGDGYGHPSPAGMEAARLARAHGGLDLEQTYSAKAMAACLDDLRRGEATGTVLFVATANSRPLAPLLAHALPTLPAPVLALLRA